MRSLSEILKTPIRIPGIKPRPRVKRAPWVLRHCPESKRIIVEKVFILAGLVAKLIFFVTGLMGIFIAPLLLAAEHPDAPVAIPIRWLRAHFSRDTGVFIYTVIWGIVAGVLTYAIIVFDYVLQHRKRPDETPERSKSDVV
jgi:hypothetical protein